jgi:hypothetical protein
MYSRLGDTATVTDQQPGEPAGFAKVIATGAMLYRLGAFKRQPNKPPRSAGGLP